MAHFAQLNEQNIVVNVIVVHDSVLQDKNGIESEELGKQWLIQWSGGHQNWVQCSYNGKIRGFFPGIGFIYNPPTDTFVCPAGYPSWTLDTQKGEFVPPIPKPQDGKNYYWNENSLNWIEEIEYPDDTV